MADNTITVDLELDDKGVKEGLKDIESTASTSFASIAKGVFAGQLSVDAFKKVVSSTIDVFKDAIKESSNFEASVNALNIALAQGGTFSKEASQSFQDFAQSIQETTKFSDDAVLSSAALLGQMTTLSNDGLKTATQAALDLSAAYRIDLDTASRLVGKATEGNVTGLQKLGITIQKGSTDAQTYANALGALARLQGSAVLSANTYEGSVAKLTNAFNDILKSLGNYITRSPALIKTFQEISRVFSGVSDAISGSNTDFFKDFIINFSIVAQAGAETARRIGLSFELAFAQAVAAFNAFKVATTLGLADATNKALDDSLTKIDEIKASFNDTTAITTFFDTLILKVQQTSGALTDLSTGIANDPNSLDKTIPSWSAASEGFSSAFQITGDLTKMNLEEIAQKSAEATARMRSDFAQVGLQARTSLGQAAGQGFAAFGKALVTGENALQAFVNAFIGAIGAACVQEGTSMILRGIGYSLDPFLAGFGPPLIQAGAALATFGGALQAVGGRGGASAGGGGVSAGGGAGGGLSTPESTIAEPEDLTSRGSSIVVNVQGNILDRRETGLELVSIINETFDSQGLSTATLGA